MGMTCKEASQALRSTLSQAFLTTIPLMEVRRIQVQSEVVDQVLKREGQWVVPKQAGELGRCQAADLFSRITHCRVTRSSRVTWYVMETLKRF